MLGQTGSVATPMNSDADHHFHSECICTCKMLQRLILNLLLLLLISTGANADADAEAFDIAFPCPDLVCYHVWSLRTRRIREDIAIVSNGRIKKAGRSNEDTQCTVRVQHVTGDDDDDDHERHYCKHTADDFTPQKKLPEVSVFPGKAWSFQCVLLSYLEQELCYAANRWPVHLSWVDQAGVAVQEDSQHGIQYQSTCHVTLTLTFHGPARETFKCRAQVGDRVWTSEELRVQVAAPRGKGRGGFDVDVEPQGSSRYQVSVVVGVLACATLAALAAMFVVVRRRKTADAAEASTSSPSNNVEDDVVYADVLLPAGAEGTSFCEGDATEYACIRYQ
ncbi:uncharacterized protein LOC129172534 isoform X2 [Dunckerocampus dactyliophorus]|uniref:uncharacterized protein LOC129172534 isoform X2 n=1 Tax=Dunckerocampus dactyliophorus TaxID=161453 RepID=UPI002406A7FC|nr:uncharacterized protein LOC129172534 isoform X2 [Dunckerocampus dactyliophorus]